MSLAKYQHKRNFHKTSEPKGDAAKPAKGSQLRFVVQKHAASRLHYDLRLEADGVMKSWAVPKGPSLNSHEKHLAMAVEDHPLEYNKFEGTIPEGNYGAGTVMVWDEGYYEPLIIDPEKDKDAEAAVLRHLGDGHLKFRLFGKKLNGEFAIVKIKNNRFGSKDNAWLLIKHDDEFANQPISHLDVSVQSGRTMDEIASGKASQPVAWAKVEKAPEVEKKSPDGQPVKAKLPQSVKPMLATLLAEPFDEPGWHYELKWDGYRALAEIDEGKVRLYSRNDQDFTTDYPEVVEALAKLPGKLVLDGEVVAVDDQGIPRFQLLQQYEPLQGQSLIYYVFDILYLDKFDLRDLPYAQRRKLLEEIIPAEGIVRLSEAHHDGIKLFHSAKKLGFEGIVAKQKDSKYVSGRSAQWLKIKTTNEREFVVGGYTKPKGNRKGFGSLLLGEYIGDDFVYRGLVGSGFDDTKILELAGRLAKHSRKTSPFADERLIDVPSVAQWLTPQMVVQVKFAEWTADKLLRHPVFVGVRTDKAAKEVQEEILLTAPGDEINVDVSQGNFTHLSKIYWPEDGFTKQDLINYYSEVGEVILPYLVDRPQNLNRHPDGIDGESFYHKNFTQSHPDWVKSQRIYSESNAEYSDYLLCQNNQSLLFLANLGCIEINPWNSRIDTLEKPDYVLFDLDPEQADFKDVVKVAQELHKLFVSVGIDSYCKTSGKRGLHIYVPLGAKYEFEQVKLFAELIATKVHQQLPKLVSLERKPDDRKGKVYIDYLQNRKGQTTATAYSVRPVKGATVSTPLSWDEVTTRLKPEKFHIKNTMARITKLGDLWEGVLGEGTSIEKILGKINLVD